MTEISAATSDLTSGVQQVASAIGQLEMVTQQNTSASDELWVGAKELSDQTEQLAETIGYFRNDPLPDETSPPEEEVADMSFSEAA